MQYVFSCCVPKSSLHILTSDIQQTYRSNHEPSGRLKECKKKVWKILIPASKKVVTVAYKRFQL